MDARVHVNRETHFHEHTAVEMASVQYPYAAMVPEIVIATPEDEMLPMMVANQLKNVASNHQGQILMPRLGLGVEPLSDLSESDVSDDFCSGYSTPATPESRDGTELDSYFQSKDVVAAKALPQPTGLATIPTELHYMIFSHLDPIDSTCLALSNSHMYSIHTSLHGKVPLNTRRKAASPLERWKGNCRQCGNHKCQLYRHLKDWMPREYEYCAVQQVYLQEAEEGAERSCYRSNPSKPGFCGRHRH